MTATRRAVLLLTVATVGALVLLRGPAAAGQGRADRPPRVEYTILLTEPQTQMVDISMTLRGIPAGALDVALPVWRPGRYALMEPAGTIRDVAARSGAGRPLTMQKVEKSLWRVDAPGGADGEVIITYRVFANSIADRSRHVDDTHAFLSPSTVLMFAPALRGEPLAVRIVAPEGWRTATGLERDPRDPDLLLAPDYDVLADSPLEIGRHETLKFEVEGAPIEIAIWNESGLPPVLTPERITGDFEKIVRAQREIFRDFPFKRYVFLVHAYPGGRGGTEHLNSTIIQTGPATLRDEDAFKRFLGLVSHEFFHTWNVKQFRPAGLAPYDYLHENYTDLLWVAEGTTSYYDDLCLVRAGLTKPDDYLKTLGSAIDAYRRRPGSMVQSLAESSFDAWIKFNRETSDSVNATVSFYDKGSLVSLLLDMEIRSRSEGRATLDDVMRDLYAKFPRAGPGYTSADVMAAAERAGGGSFREFFEDHVTGTTPLDFESAVGTVGLEVRIEPSTSGGPGARDASASAQKEPATRAYLGFSVEAREGLAGITSVLADGPAYRAGLLAGDVLLAIDGVRLKPTELDARLKHVKPGSTVRLTIFRYERLRDLEVKAEERPSGKWAVRRVRQATDDQRAAYASWLGQPWPGRRPSRDQESEPEERP
ncbi:MAG: PDZ domain-containing protein [Phycisphaerales bacterium]